MFHCLIFSKNRAAQLHLFLDSIIQNAPIFESIDVIYKSDQLFKPSYDILKIEFPNVNWVEEKDFRADTISCVKGDYILPTVDDSVFYQKFNEKIIIEALKENFTFVLGVGLNTTFHWLGQYQIKMPIFIDKKDYLVWDWKKLTQPSEFNCPFMITSNIYKTEEFKKYLNLINFNTPNTLEQQLQINFKDVGNMCCFKESVLVNMPINRVQNEANNLFGLNYGYDEIILNKKYLARKKLKLNQIDFSNIIGMHQEFQLY